MSKSRSDRMLVVGDKLEDLVYNIALKATHVIGHITVYLDFHLYFVPI